MKAPRTEPSTHPRGTLTEARLRAYLAGQLGPEEAHEVELHMEASELHREAAEGFATVPGAPPLPGHPKAVGGRWGRWALVAMLVVVVIGLPLRLLLPLQTAEEAPVLDADTPAIATVPDLTTTPMLEEEMRHAVEQPESLRIGHGATERHMRGMHLAERPVERSNDAQQLDTRVPPADALRPAPTPSPARAARPSRQLVFLHDMKLVHPDELLSAHPGIRVEPGGLSADRATPDDVPRDGQRMRYMGYLEYMEGALGHFVSNDHRACLEDLLHLLQQYPDDVNALFYAGLSSYNLGLYGRACALLEGAATHAVDTFDEEAAWYHASCVERQLGPAAAEELYQTIAEQGGFYAERAAARVVQRP
jgi:hypothetical protein